MKSSDANSTGRYARQLLFEPIGKKGQKKLHNSRVAVIGCGGLGSVIANNLARSGVGFIRIVDKDRVDISNLQRQLLFDENDMKKKSLKVEAAKEKLGIINSEIRIYAVADNLNNKNIERTISDVDLIMDGTDNFKTRFLINKISIE